MTCSVKLIYSSTFFSTSTNKRSEFKNLKVKRSSFQVQLSKAKIRSKDVHNLEAQAVRVSHHAATTTSTGHSHLRSTPQPSPLIPSPDFFKSGYIPKMFLTCRNILFFRICWTTWPGQGPWLLLPSWCLPESSARFVLHKSSMRFVLQEVCSLRVLHKICSSQGSCITRFALCEFSTRSVLHELRSSQGLLFTNFALHKLRSSQGSFFTSFHEVRSSQTPVIPPYPIWVPQKPFL